MSIHRRMPGRRTALAALALGLGTLTACGAGPLGSDSEDPADPANPANAATPPTVGSTQAAGKSTKKPKSTSRSLRDKVIVIDPGHNGRNGANPGIINRQVDIGNGRKECDTSGTATAAGYTEAAFTWDVSVKLAKLLQAKGAQVTLTRKNNTGVGPCITERAAIGNRADADAVLSVHADGAPTKGHGFHIIEPKAVRGLNETIVSDSHQLGVALRDAFREGTQTPYSTYVGTRAMNPRDDLGGLNLSKVPKVFLECGNMKNPAEAARLSSAAFRQKIAESLVNGFELYFR